MNEEKLPFCKCGCGNRVTKPGNKFIHGHNRKNKKHTPETITKIIKAQKENRLNPKLKLKSQLCECGCGDYAKPGNKFIVGHNKKGTHDSDETKARKSKVAKMRIHPIPGKKHSLKSIQKMSDKKNEWNRNHPGYYEGENNPNFGKITPDCVKRKISETIQGNNIVKHHYIYDHNDLTKYTIEMTRSAHTKLHWLLRKANIKIPHINIKEDIHE